MKLLDTFHQLIINFLVSDELQSSYNFFQQYGLRIKLISLLLILEYLSSFWGKFLMFLSVLSIINKAIFWIKLIAPPAQ